MVPVRANVRRGLQKPAIVAATIAAAGAIVVALIGRKEGDGTSVSSTIIARGSSNVAIGVRGGGNNVTVNPTDTSVRRLLERGLPESDHPVIDLSRSVASQLRLYAEDEVRIVAVSQRIDSVWFGDRWLSFDYNRDYNRRFTVMGPEGQPVTPKFAGLGFVKLEVSFTRYRDRPRDIRQP
jgi:hypothetical protein